MTEQNSARELFRAAYENRYTWDENFPGYEAEMTIAQGDESYTGTVRVGPDLGVEIEGIADEKVKESAYNQMRDIITHRKRNSFENAHGKNEFSLGETSVPGGTAINVKGDAMGSHYVVRDREICQVNRVMGPVAFTINTAESLDTGEGYVSKKYSAVFRNSKDDSLRGKSDFEEDYEAIGNYYIPVRQTIHSLDGEGNQTTTEFRFQQIRLLESVAA